MKLKDLKALSVGTNLVVKTKKNGFSCEKPFDIAKTLIYTGFRK